MDRSLGDEEGDNADIVVGGGVELARRLELPNAILTISTQSKFSWLVLRYCLMS
jgi:hypothetical protein